MSNSESEAAEFEANLVRLTNQLAYPQGSKESVVVDVLLVDDSALFRVEGRGLQWRVSRVKAKTHSPAPTQVVTTVPVVNSVGRLEVRIAEAIENGLLEIEANSSAAPLKAAAESKSAIK